MARISSKTCALLILLSAFALLFPLVVKSPVYLDIFIMFCLMAGLGGAWNIIGGYGGQFSIGHAGFFGIGAYTSTLLYMHYGLSPWIGTLVGAGLAAVVSLSVFFPFFRLKGVFFAMASLAFAEIMSIVSIYWTSVTRGNVGLLILFKPSLRHMLFVEKTSYAYLALLYMAVVVAVSVLVKRSKLGSYLQGIREDEDAAESLGVRSTKCKCYAIMISAALTAVGGTVYAQYVQFIDPDTLFNVDISVRFALLPIIGGMGTVAGPVVGSAVLTPLDTLLRSWLGSAYSGLGFLTYGAVLIVCVLALPEGIMKWIRDNIHPSIEKLPDFVVRDRRVLQVESGSAESATLSAVGQDYIDKECAFMSNGQKEKLPPGESPIITAKRSGQQGEVLMEIEGATKIYGGLKALDNVSVTVKRGEILGLIGPNGAGKTTLFNVISGFHRLDKGKIIFKKKDITKLAPSHKVCMEGIGRTFQIVKPFSHITVFDNVLVGAWLRNGSAMLARRTAGEVLHFVGLDKYAGYPASNLTLADRKRLELARALATAPELLLLDEVMAGLNPAEIEEISGIVKKISSEMDITLFIIEHVMRAIMGLSQRIVVLDYGKLMAQGKPEEIAKDESVIKAYLGEEYLYHAAGSEA